MKKVGRNELCPCGSGKKYKKCCLQKEEEFNTFYRSITKSSNDLMIKYSRFVVGELGEQVLDEAVIDFFMGREEDQDRDNLLHEFGSLFWPWFFFCWTIDPVDLAFSELQENIPPDTTMAELYSQRKGDDLDKREQSVFSAMNRKPFTFLEIKEVSTDKGFYVQDMIAGSEFFVIDPELSKWVSQDDIIYAKPCNIDGHWVLIGVSETKVPPDRESRIVDLRTWLMGGYGEITEQLLWDNMMYTRDIYLEMYFDRFRLPPVDDVEEEGQEVAFRTVYYDIESPERAFEALYPLSGDYSREELLENAVYDPDGNLQEVEIPWSPGEEDEEEQEELIEEALFGMINIEGNTLSVECIREDRAEEIKHIIDSRLGSDASYRKTEVESIDEYMAEPDDLDDDEDF